MADWFRSQSPLTEPPSPPLSPRGRLFNTSSPGSPLPAAGSSPFPSPLRRVCRKSKKKFRGRRGFDSLDQFSAIYDSVWEPISCYSHAEALHSKNGYKGASRTLDEYPELTGCASERLRKLKNKGYQISRYIEGKTRIYIDRQGKIFAFACPPDCNSERVARLSSEVTRMEVLAKGTAMGQAKRGEFKCLCYGISKGPGSKYPSPRCVKSKRLRALRRFFKSHDLRNHLQPAINMWQALLPKVYNHYKKNMRRILGRYRKCYQAVPNLPFAGFTLNCSPQCICKKHVDLNNLATGLCLINPLGFYDYKEGGHLILHDAKLIIEVPAGSQIFIPSAIIAHETIPVASHETRNAFTGYSAATLFQFVDNRFKLLRSLRRNIIPGRKVWKSGLDMYPILGDHVSLNDPLLNMN